MLLNQWNRHRFALHATPPASLARPLDVRADFTHPRFAANRAQVSLWKGELYADLRDTGAMRSRESKVRTASSSY